MNRKTTGALGLGLAAVLAAGVALPAQAATNQDANPTTTQVSGQQNKEIDPVAISLNSEAKAGEPMSFNVYVNGPFQNEPIKIWYRNLDSEGYPVGGRHLLATSTHDPYQFDQVITADKALPAGKYDIQVSIGNYPNDEWSYVLWVDVV